MEHIKLGDKITFVEKPFAKRIVYQDDKVVTFTLSFKPGQALPPHTHFDSTVVVLVYAGAGEIIADEKTISVNSGDVITVKGHEVLSVNNNGQENLTLYVNMAPRPADERYSKDVG